MSSQYIGRFAPSPSGPLHNGSLVAAMASYLDAKAHHGKWLLRIEDIDTPRVVPEADKLIMQQLQQLGMLWDGEPIWQSQRLSRYEECFAQLLTQRKIYGCSCTRKEIMEHSIALGLANHGQYPYSGKCRQGNTQAIRSWRLQLPDKAVLFNDRWVGKQVQNPQKAVGDMIVKRADGLFAYQLAVVIDDGDQGVTDIVRGQDLLDSTQRQLCLADDLGIPHPRYMHVPLILDEQGRKLSKQNHAPALDAVHALESLQKAWQALGFEKFRCEHIEGFWSEATARWGKRFI